MRVFLQTLASLSLSGSLLILLLWALRPWLRGKINRRCQYLLWLAAALRLLLPFSPETNLMNWLFRLAEAPAQAAEEVLPAKQPQADQIDPLDLPPSLRFPGYLYARETAEKPASQAPAAPVPAVSNASFPWKKAASMGLTALWLAGFIIAAGRRLWAYRRFCRQTAARLIPPDPAALEIAERLRRQLSIRYPLPLWALPGAASPFLAWLGRPCVLLPAAAFAPEQLKAALLHELTHYKRRDLASKALLQLVLCVHWFNPLVYRLVRLAQQDCELACDEGVLARLDPAQRLAYGDALLDFSLFSISYPAPAAPLGADGLLLKERLEAVARFRPNDKRRLLQGAAALAAVCCAALAVGAYAGTEAPKPAAVSASAASDTLAAPALFYENNYLFTLSPCPFPEQAEEKQQRASYLLVFAPGCQQWRYDARLVNGVDKALAGKSVQAALLESVNGPYDENADQLAWRFYEEDALDAFEAALTKASAHMGLELAERAYQEDRLSYFALAALKLDASSAEQIARQAAADRKASYLYPLAPLLEEEFRYELADQAAKQSCYGCFMPLFENLNAQSRLAMCRQAMADRDVLRFSMMGGRIAASQRIQLAWEAYEADDLEFFSLAVSRLSTQQRQPLAQQAYQDSRMKFFNVVATPRQANYEAEADA